MAETKRADQHSDPGPPTRPKNTRNSRPNFRQIDLSLAAFETGRPGRPRRPRARPRKRISRAKLAGALTSLERIEVDLQRIQLEIVEKEKAAQARLENPARTFRANRASSSRKMSFLHRRIEDNQARRGPFGRGPDSSGTEKGRTWAPTCRACRPKFSSARSQAAESNQTLDELRAVYGRAQGRNTAGAVIGREEAGRKLSEVRNRLARLEEVIAGCERQAERQAAPAGGNWGRSVPPPVRVLGPGSRTWTRWARSGNRLQDEIDAAPGKVSGHQEPDVRRPGGPRPAGR